MEGGAKARGAQAFPVSLWGAPALGSAGWVYVFDDDNRGKLWGNHRRGCITPGHKSLCFSLLLISSTPFPSSIPHTLYFSLSCKWYMPNQAAIFFEVGLSRACTLQSIYPDLCPRISQIALQTWWLFSFICIPLSLAAQSIAPREIAADRCAPRPRSPCPRSSCPPSSASRRGASPRCLLKTMFADAFLFRFSSLRFQV